VNFFYFKTPFQKYENHVKYAKMKKKRGKKGEADPKHFTKGRKTGGRGDRLHTFHTFDFKTM